MSVPTNILQRITLDPPEMIIWARKALRCPLGSSAPEKGVILEVIKWGGMGFSMMACEKCLGLSHAEISEERARTSLRTCLCTVLHSSSFVIHISSFIQTASSITFLDWCPLPLAIFLD